MKVGKPYMKVIKAAFDFNTKEARAFLYLCKNDPHKALGLAGEYGKRGIVEAIIK